MSSDSEESSVALSGGAQREENINVDLEISPPKETKFSASEIQERQKYFRTFIDALVAEAATTVFTQGDAPTLQAPARYTPDEAQEILDLLLPQAMGDFREYREIFLIFVDSLLQVLTAHRRIRNQGCTISDALRFMLIGLNFGPDRAITASKNQDELWKDVTKKGKRDSDVYDFGAVPTSKLSETELERTRKALKFAREFHSVLIEGKPTTHTLDASFASSGKANTSRNDDALAELTQDQVETETEVEVALQKDKETPVSVAAVSPPKSSETRITDVKKPERTSEAKPPTTSSTHSTPPTNPWAPKTPIMREYQRHPEYVEAPPARTPHESPVLRAFKEHSVAVDGPAAATALGVSSGVAQGIYALTKEGKENTRPILIRVPTPQLSDDRRLLTFDYNIRGRDQDEILGPIFRRTYFPNEGARQETMKALFQRVIDDPDVLDRTKRIALAQMDQLDVARLHTQNTTLSAFKAANAMATDPEEEQDAGLVKVPTLGNRSITTSMVKSLYALMGIDGSQKFSIEDPNSKPLKAYLRPLGTKITAERLGPDDAYALLSNLVTGHTHEQVQAAWHIEKIPFEQFWVTLQKVANRTTSVSAFKEDINRLLSKKPAHIEEVLTEIKNLRFKIHAAEKNELIRNTLIERDTIGDFTYLMRTFYPEVAPNIYAEYHNRLSAQKLEEATFASYGQPYVMPHKIYTLMEVICSVLAEDLTSGRPRLEVTKVVDKKEGRAKISTIGISQPEEVILEATISTLQDVGLPNGAGPGLQQNKAPPGGWQPNGTQPTNENQQPNRHPQLNQPPGQQPNGHHQLNEQQQQPNGYQQDYRNNDPDSRRTLHCLLCNRTGHTADRCFAYKGMEPMDTKCPQCHGLHPGPCRRRPFLPGEGRPPSRRPRSNRQNGVGGGMREVFATLQELQRENKMLAEKFEKLGNGPK